MNEHKTYWITRKKKGSEVIDALFPVKLFHDGADYKEASIAALNIRQDCDYTLWDNSGTFGFPMVVATNCTETDLCFRGLPPARCFFVARPDFNEDFWLTHLTLWDAAA
ncbi:MAG: hypothetical protein WC962_10435 [Phycisphaerae bacterium]|jgi:hypothetical protein